MQRAFYWVNWATRHTEIRRNLIDASFPPLLGKPRHRSPTKAFWRLQHCLFGSLRRLGLFSFSLLASSPIKIYQDHEGHIQHPISTMPIRRACDTQMTTHLRIFKNRRTSDFQSNVRIQCGRKIPSAPGIPFPSLDNPESWVYQVHPSVYHQVSSTNSCIITNKHGQLHVGHCPWAEASGTSDTTAGNCSGKTLLELVIKLPVATSHRVAAVVTDNVPVT